MSGSSQKRDCGSNTYDNTFRTKQKTDGRTRGPRVQRRAHEDASPPAHPRPRKNHGVFQGRQGVRSTKSRKRLLQSRENLRRQWRSSGIRKKYTLWRKNRGFFPAFASRALSKCWRGTLPGDEGHSLRNHVLAVNSLAEKSRKNPGARIYVHTYVRTPSVEQESTVGEGAGVYSW